MSEANRRLLPTSPSPEGRGWGEGYVGAYLGPEAKKAADEAAFEAEGTRFELVVQNNPYGSLANCWFQPLTHPSGLKALKPRLSGRDCKGTKKFLNFAILKTKP